MSIVATSNKFRTDDVEEAIPVDVSMPLHNAMELYVIYGEAGLEALLNVDYTITLNEADWSNFVFTPLESLIDKINAQIAAEPTDRNTVLMVRELPLTTPSTPQASRDTTFVSREHDRTIMRFQQIEEQLARAIKGDINDEDFVPITFPSWSASAVIAWHPTTPGLLVNSDSAVFYGKSAYEIAVEEGFVGDEAAWLASLVSTVPGPPGAVNTIVPGIGISVDLTNPAAPVVTNTGPATGQIIALILGLAI